MKEAFCDVLDSCRASDRSGPAFREFCMHALARLPNYDWSGVYRLEGDELVLETFVGAPTGHTRIPVGRGVCGTAVKERTNQVVKDVAALENYLSCSLETKAEIVVLIWSEGAILGQIDVDSHSAGAFGPEDEALLEGLAALIAERWDATAEP